MERIAIVGIGCRFPGARGPREFWRLLASGTCAVGEVPPDRWDLEAFYAPQPGRRGRMASRWGGFLSEIDRFDADFFRITPDEADRMDPQQRLVLEVAYETLEDAGVPSGSLAGEKVGVFLGISNADYTHVQFADPDQVDQYSLTGTALSIAANRISYVFDLRGPSLAVDTACSSSLVAVHQACASLRAGECSMALVGGVNLMLSPMVSIGYSQAYADSPDGVCRAFGAGANGTVRGEGAGLVLLRPLEEAERSGDRIYAVIRGSAINQDGLTNGLAAPSPAGQRAVVADACRAAGVDPGRVAFVEAHGTGTELGDPIEARALGDVLGASPQRETPCLLGSVKTNLGHLEAAAGVAGLIKAALGLRFRRLPPSLHFQGANPRIPFDELNLKIAGKLEDLPAGPLLAGVSSFGFGGTNSHVILESFEGEAAAPHEEVSRPRLLPLSARDEEALDGVIEGLLERSGDALDLADLGHTLAHRRDHHPVRAAVVCADREELRSALEERRTREAGRPLRKRRLAFVCPGMGSQQPGMGHQLLGLPAFRESLARSQEALAELSDIDLVTALEDYERAEDEPDAGVVQPLLLALQLGLADQWRAWGVTPDLVLGTSLGEVAAACVAGILSVEDAFRIVVRRVPVLRPSIGQGGVAVVGMHHEELEPLLEGEGEVWVAARNSPNLTGFSGREEVIDRLVARFRGQGLFSRRIRGAVAPSHSPLMEPFEAGILEAFGDVVPRDGEIPLVSTVTGEVVVGSELRAEYWWRNIRRPIELTRAVEAVEAGDSPVYLELSAHPVLSAAVLDSVQETGREPVVLGSLQRGARDPAPMLRSLGRLWELGWEVPWQEINGEGGGHMSLPSYPWQGESYWLDVGDTGPVKVARRPSRKPAGPGGARRPAALDRETLDGMAPEAAREALLDFLRHHVARALKLDVAGFDDEKPLKDLGVGSLMGMELYSRLRRDLQVRLPTSKVLSGPSLRELADMVLAAVGGAAPGPAARPDAGGEAPLSFAQRRIWFLEQLEPERTLFNIPIQVRVNGPLDLDRLQRSLDVVVERHDILRTVFRSRDGAPYQVALPELPSPLLVDDARELEKWEQFDLGEARLREDAHAPFDLERGPLFRARVIQLSPEEHLLSLTSHHLIMDGWSLGVWLSELGEVYAARTRGEEPELEALPFQYADFARWQREGADAARLREQQEVWLRRLAGAPERTTLIPDRPRPPAQGFEGEVLPFRIDADTRGRLEALAREQECSLFALLLSAFQVLLHRLTLQTDLVVGTPVLGRGEAGLDRLIGVFVNMLPLRADLRGDPGFTELLEQTREVTEEAFDNQEVPFEQLVEALQPSRRLSHSPVFQVVFALHAPVGALDFADLEVRREEADPGRSKYDLTLSLFPTDEGLQGDIEFDTDLFDRATIDRVRQHYLALLADILRDPSRPVSRLGLVEGGEDARWDLATVIGASLPDIPDQPVLDQFRARVAKHGSRPALVDGERVLSYEELDAMASRVANALREQGVGPGDLVAVRMPRSPEMIAAWLGALGAGAAYLPLDPGEAEDRVSRILEDAAPELVLGELPEGGEPGWPEVECGDCAYVIYTSGSTGTPRGVEVSHGSLENLVHWHRHAYDVDPETRATQLASPGFDASVWEVWPHLCAGAAVHLVPEETRADPVALRDWLLDEEIHLTFVPTPLLERMLELDWPEESCLRAVLTGGDRLRRWPEERHPFRLFNHYGPTECTVVASWCEITADADAALPPIGRPLPGTCVHLLDGELRPVPPGTPGEIVVAGANVALGYRGAPEITRERFVEHPDIGERVYRTGDHARLRASRDLEFLGRADQQVKVDGVRIELGEIEARLAEDDMVERALVLQRDGELSAWVMPAGDQADLLTHLRARLRRVLPSRMVPRRWAQLAELPLTSRGKVDLMALPAAQPLSDVDAGQVVAPRTPLEEELADLWRQVLGLEEAVGVETSFFQLGGRSLLAVQLLARVEERFRVRVPLRALFEEPTVAALARLVSSPDAEPAPLPALEPDPAGRHWPFPLTDVQQAYWIGRGHGFELSNVAAHAYVEFDLESLDVARLQQAVRALVERHEMLRVIVDEEGRARVLESVPEYRVEVTDLAGREQGLEELRERYSHELRDPGRWPLFDVRVTRVDEARSRLHLAFEALIADASSLVILARELAALYEDPAAALPEIGLSFRDYALALRALEDGAGWRRSFEYWRERIQELPPAPGLPLAASPEAIERPHFRRLEGRLDPVAWTSLKEAGRDHGLTPSTLLLAAFAEVLARWSEEPRFTLNLTVFDRRELHPDVAGLVGDFTNLLLVGVDWSRPGNFLERALALQDRLWEDMEHRQVSGVRVFRELARLRGPEAARMPVVFTSALFEAPEAEGELRLDEPVHAITQTPQVWLDHQVREARGALAYNWDFPEGLFHEGMLEAMFQTYRERLEALAQDAAAWTGPRAPLPESQLEARRRANDTASGSEPVLLHELFLEAARTHPHRTAVSTSGARIDYSKLEALSSGIAARLVAAGVEPGQRVGVRLPKGWEQVAAVLGVLRAGAAYVPLNPEHPESRLEVMKRTAGITHVVDRVDPDDEGDPLTAPVDLAPDALAYVIFTSGSTGTPKGVVIEHAAAANTILEINRRFGLGPDDRVLALSGLDFDLSVWDIFGVLAAGGTVVMPDPGTARDPAHWVQRMEAEQVTVWNSVPTLMKMMVEHGDGPSAHHPEGLRLILLSGDWIPVPLATRLRELYPEAELISLGGATEASIWSIAHPISEVDPDWTSVPYGRPLANQRFHVLDGELEDRPVHVPGRLFIAGDGLAREYLGDPERTAASFLVHPVTGERLYDTGDMARYLPDGTLEFLGRRDHQVKIQGHRIELGEVEAALRADERVGEAVVVARGPARGERHLVAYVVPADPEAAPPGSAELEAALQEHLPCAMVPSAYETLEELPLTANGKVDRDALPLPAGSAPAPAAPVDAGIRRVVAGIVCEVLGLESIDPDTDLLSLGANSVDVVRMANRLEESLGSCPPASEIFRLRTVADLARHFEEVGAAPGRSPDRGTTLILDPAEREAFKASRPGLRELEGSATALPGEDGDEDFRRYRTSRRFLDRAVPLESLGNLLASIREVELDGGHRHRYGSAGSLYPVQAYLWLRPGGVEGAAGGTWYYHPARHALLPLDPAAHIDRSVHFYMNTPIFDGSRFSIFLIADLDAIEPIYGSSSRDYCLLEAGAQAQLLRMRAADAGVGLCAIGELDFPRIRAGFRLHERHQLLHTLLGGVLDEDPSSRDMPISRTGPVDEDDWEEIRF